MKLHNTGVLAILITGNLLLWGERFSPRGERSFDFAGFQEQMLSMLPASQLASLPFEANPLLPDEYVYLQASDQYLLSMEGNEVPWFSVYVGYYPELGLTGKEPHDPRVCYEVAQFSALKDEFVQLRLPELVEEPLFLKRLLVEYHAPADTDGESQTYQRIAFYWRHAMGNMPIETPGGLTEFRNLSQRLLNRRSDLIWVRVELLLPEPLHGQPLPPELDPETTRRLYRIMQAAAASML